MHIAILTFEGFNELDSLMILNQVPESARMFSDARSTRAFLRLEFTCSQGSP
ncbi:hypothetical protein [Pseudomonas corrugata]|uniref:hypothetical protein n=1 Tax=Pseudomonas corrugata TaxID=47879 RepID=UPI0022346B46|nr:hypothetical protein [Pseudomonas corrugata]UZE04459.1 hypothetical protein LOY65_17315 [Pseudomonas corrugata]